MTLEQTITQIPGPQAKAMEQAKKRWDTIAKPLDSLGLLEEAVVRIAGLTGDSGYRIDKRCVAVLCADMKTNIPGVFAAGDIRVKSLRQVVTAAADGAIAAVQCEKYLG